MENRCILLQLYEKKELWEGIKEKNENTGKRRWKDSKKMKEEIWDYKRT